MTIKVELEKLLAVAAGFGTVPMLLTCDDDARPRATAVGVEWDGTTALVRVGRKSLANAGVRPQVSLLWPAPPGERFALLVDGTAVGADPDPDQDTDRTSGGCLVVQATSAILHAVDRKVELKPSTN